MKSLYSLSLAALTLGWTFETVALPAPVSTNQQAAASAPAPAVIAAAPQTGTEATPPSTSPGTSGEELTAQVMRMAQTGADSTAIKSFIQGWSQPYSISADEILHLHDVGVPSGVLTALISHGAELQATQDVQNEQAQNELVMTNPPAVLYPYPEPSAGEQTNPPAVIYPYPYPYPVPVPSETYPDYGTDYSYAYPSAVLPGLYSPYYLRNPVFVPRYAYPYRYGYGYRYRYPYHPYGYGHRGYGRGYGGYSGHYGGRSFGWRGGGGYGGHGRR